MKETLLKGLLFDIKKEALRKGYEIAVSTTGNSMFPSIMEGDRVVIARCNTKKLKCGDLIVFSRNGNANKIVAHRIVLIIREDEKHRFITKGDFQIYCDKAIGSDLVIGKIIRIEKPHFSISLESVTGRLINIFMLCMSLNRIMPVTFRILLKSKDIVCKRWKS